MRLSETGKVEWYNQVSTMKGISDCMTAVTMANSYVYGFVISSDDYNTRTHAVMKFTYNEGKT